MMVKPFVTLIFSEPSSSFFPLLSCRTNNMFGSGIGVFYNTSFFNLVNQPWILSVIKLVHEQLVNSIEWCTDQYTVAKANNKTANQNITLLSTP